MKAILLSGGRGTRLQPLTHTNNKHVIPLANKPLIMYPFQNILDAGIKEIAVIVNETKPEIEKILGDGSEWGVKVTYIVQDNPGGLAHAMSLGEEFVGEDKFIMVLGDNMLEKGFADVAKKFEQSDLNGMVLGIKYPKEVLKRLGCALVIDGLVSEYVEKPQNPTKDHYGVPGFYFADSNIFKSFKGEDKIKPSARGELEIPSPYNWLLKHGFKVGFEEVKGWWKDPGKPEDMLDANRLLLDWRQTFEQKGEIKDSKLEGNIEVKEGAKIINSKLRGPLSIGKGVTIKDSYIGPYTSVGDNTTVENAQIENSIIMGSATIHDVKTRLDSCLIGWDVEVTESEEYPKSTSLFVGDNSIVDL